MVAHEIGQGARKLFHSDQPSLATVPFWVIEAVISSIPDNR